MADARTERPDDTVNETIRDRSIRHLVWLTRLQTQQAERVRQFLEDKTIPELEARLQERLKAIEARGQDIGPVVTARLNSQIEALNEIVDADLEQLRRESQDEIASIAQSEAEWQVGAVKQSLPVSVEMAIPAPEQLRQAVLSRPFDGQPLQGWFEGLERDTRTRLAQSIRQGITQQEPVQQIVQRIRGTRAEGFQDGVMRTTTRNAQAIARTSVIHANTQARDQTIQVNDDVIKGVQWVATLDSRTCPICQGLDGNQYERNSGPRPPIHVQCRCTMTMVTRSWQELGFEQSELSESTRASMDGQVPDSLTYGEWLRRKVNEGDMEVVEEALGPKRAKLFAAGGMNVEQFTNRQNRMLTLEELREVERSTFERAGVDV